MSHRLNANPTSQLLYEILSIVIFSQLLCHFWTIFGQKYSQLLSKITFWSNLYRPTISNWKNCSHFINTRPPVHCCTKFLNPVKLSHCWQFSQLATILCWKFTTKRFSSNNPKTADRYSPEKTFRLKDITSHPVAQYQIRSEFASCFTFPA